MSRNLLFAGLCLTLVAAACGGGRARRASAGPPVVLEVQNDANLDMTMYAVEQNGNRSRLGLATAHRITFLSIPNRIIFGLTPLRFQADPIGAAANPVTPEITVEAGDTVVMRIPPSGNISIGR